MSITIQGMVVVTINAIGFILKMGTITDAIKLVGMVSGSDTFWCVAFFIYSIKYSPVKPKDFKLDNFDKEFPFLKECLLYVPKSERTFDWEVYFPNTNPCVIEYCSGNGSWIVDKAIKEKEKNFIAVERRFDRVRKIISKCKNQGAANLLVVWGEALNFTKFYVKKETISEIFINFPDPWPKRRHEKHRLLNSEFVHELERVLETDGKITMATDDEPYVQSSMISFQQNPKFNPKFVQEIPNYGSSFFENLWRDKGRTIFYINVKKYA